MNDVELSVLDRVARMRHASGTPARLQPALLWKRGLHVSLPTAVSEGFESIYTGRHKKKTDYLHVGTNT